MAWQRKIPFGYQVQNGRINCQPEEAKFVRSIFSHYLLGSSYSQIADEMARQGVRYHQHTAQWNKHMVKRILENERYLGMDGYPRLVTDEEFLAVRLRRREQNTYAPCPSEIIPISLAPVRGIFLWGVLPPVSLDLFCGGFHLLPDPTGSVGIVGRRPQLIVRRLPFRQWPCVGQMPPRQK